MKDLTPMDVESKIITLREQQVILDYDVAELYGVETKEINQAVRNNPKKFPDGYIFQIDNQEFHSLRSKFLTLKSNGRGQHKKYLPKALTEKGLYMLATILKSPKAVETTIAIVETFAKLKELSRVIVELPNEEHGESQRQSLLQRGSQLVNEILDDTLPKRSSETSFELNLAILKLKHSVKRENDDRIAALEKKIEELTKDKG
ncbi:MAG: ORF6N domain-containing protein [Bacteroidales bacterium]|nr:ORF6N domain-containing protein [Bacteroidales bacterium]